ncbi:MAG: hypothetical protein L6V84_05695 [Oscillospiraceae bacterium]|nr:MAG: hypothetical protein L6V84_05695 [Oscillospiraceae bacterium]
MQDAENSVAIEVTDSVTPNDAQIIGEFTKLSQVNSEKNRRKNVAKKSVGTEPDFSATG